LHLGGRAVDLVGEDQVREDRPLLKLELALPALGKIDLGTGDVGGQEIGGELDTRQFRIQVLRQALDGSGLCKAGQALDEQVAIGEQTKQQPLNHRILADNRLPDTLAQIKNILTCRHFCSSAAARSALLR